MCKDKIGINQIREIVAKALQCSVDSVSCDSGLSKHEKWDSVGQIQIIVEIENTFGISVNELNIEHFINVKKIFEYLNGR